MKFLACLLMVVILRRLEKLPYLENAFERFKEAYRNYVGEILDENTINEAQCYLEGKRRKVHVFRQPIIDWRINIKHKLLAESLQVDLAVNPEDSISCAARQFFLVLPTFQNIQVEEVLVVAVLNQLKLRERKMPLELPN